LLSPSSQLITVGGTYDIFPNESGFPVPDAGSGKRGESAVSGGAGSVEVTGSAGRGRGRLRMNSHPYTAH